MKVKVISRDRADYTRTTKHDIQKVATNLDPKLHPLEAPREYQRALNATKLERTFAKPFVGALAGHTDGVSCLAKHPTKLTRLLSGSCDGELRLWDLSSKKCLHVAKLHQGFVQGVCMTPDGNHYVTVGQDKHIRIGKLSEEDLSLDSEMMLEEPTTIMSKNFFTGVDHHRRQSTFATSGSVVDLWSMHRSEPITSFSWGADTINTIKFNPVEVNVLATAADDRNIVLYDIRAATPIRKLIMAMKTNKICWNPMEAFNFTCANEDHNLYTFDMRKMTRAINVHKDHVSAVLDIDYSPTGKEFVSGGYDKSTRIFSSTQGRSREVYHTKRMQRIFAVQWSSDNKYVLTGSDEMNIRLWKTDASEHLGTMSARQRSAQKYNTALKDRFRHHPDIKRIARHRHVPKAIFKAKALKATMERAASKKVANAIQHKSVKTPKKFKAEREKHIVGEIK
eukprot:m.32831 g.32831  ORF g.32831 m.32831 type:complete len:451 (-) comp16707_c0_seq1:116-1468(-)